MLLNSGPLNTSALNGASGASAVSGTSTVSRPSVAGSVSGGHGVAGTTLVALLAFGGSAAGLFATPITGTSTAARPSVAGSIAGTFNLNPITGTSTKAMPSVAGSVTGSHGIGGTSTVARPSVGGSAAGSFTLVILGTSTASLPSVGGSESGLLGVTGTSTASRPSPGGSASGSFSLVVTGSSTAALPGSSVTAAATFTAPPPSWRNVNLDTAIDGPTFRAKFQAAYTAKLALQNALTTQAKAPGDAALLALVKIASDGWLTAGEKPAVLLDWNDINDSKAGLLLSAASFSPVIDSTAFAAAWRALADYLNEGTTYTTGVPSALQTPYTDTVIASPSTWNSTWKAAFSTRADLTAAISSHTKTLADTAVLDLAKIASDGWLTAGEIPSVVVDWNDLNDSKAGLVSRAASFSPAVSSTAFVTAWQTLADYLNNTAYGTFTTGTPSCLQTPYTTQAIASPATWLANWKSAYSARSALQDAITAATKLIGDTHNSPDYLTPADKMNLLAAWNSETVTQTALHADAATRGTVTTTYDAAVTAVDTYLISKDAAWKTTWATSTTTLGPVAGILTTVNGLWATVAQRRAELQGAITSDKYANAVSTAATDATNKANVAQLAAQPHRVAWAYTALPALSSGNLATYPDGYYAITTDMRTVQRSGNVWIDVTVATTGLFGQIFSKSLTLVNFDNLFPNPNGIPTTGYTSTQMFDHDRWAMVDATSPTGYCHRMAGLGGTGGGPNQAGVGFEGLTAWTPKQNLVPVIPGEQYYMEGYFHTETTGSTTVYGGLYAQFDGGSSYIASNLIGTGNPCTTGWTKLSVIITVPANASQMRCMAWAQSDAVVRVTSLTLRRRNDATLLVDGAVKAIALESDLAMVNVIRSQNYAAGSYGNAPVGFKLSGYTFTSTMKDGTTVAANLEIGGDINLNGYKAATVTSRACTAFNRLRNGYFYLSLEGWQMINSGADVVYNPTYSSPSAGGGCASSTSSITSTAILYQSVSIPPPIGTVNLTFSTACSTTSGSSISASVKAYLYDPSIGTETLLATYTYSGVMGTTPSWSARSIDVSSYVVNGGDYAIMFKLQVATPNGDTVTTYLDNVKLIL